MEGSAWSTLFPKVWREGGSYDGDGIDGQGNITECSPAPLEKTQGFGDVFVDDVAGAWCGLVPPARDWPASEAQDRDKGGSQDEVGRPDEM